MELITPELGLIFWQLVVFLLVVFTLTKFAWKPIISALNERENQIEGALAAARQAEERMVQLNSANEQLLAEARTERDRIMREANAAAAQIVESARAEAAVKVAQDLDKFRQTIAGEKAAAIVEIKNMVAAYSLNIAEKVIRKNLSNDNEQQNLVKEFLKDAPLASKN